MATKGRSVLGKINDRVHSAERKHRSTRDELTQNNSSIRRLQNKISNNYSRLAEIYLPELDTQSVQETLTELQGRVEKIYVEKQGRIQTLDTLIDKCELDRREQEAKIETLYDSIVDMELRIESTSEAIKESLERNITYKRLEGEIERATQDVSTANQQKSQIRNQVNSQLQGYEDSKIFQYLLNKSFGTSGYSGGLFTTPLDNLLSRRIDFKEAKKKYDLLKSLPEAADERQKEAENALKDLERQKELVVEQTEAEFGLTKILMRYEELKGQKASADRNLDILNKNYNRYSSEAVSLESETGKYHKEGLNLIEDYLKGKSISDLMKIALRTETLEDDRLVEGIDKYQSDISQLKIERKTLRSREVEAQDKVKGLRKIQREFKSHRYDGSRSRFRNINTNSLLDDFESGRKSVYDVNRRIERAQYFERDPYTYSSSSSSSSSSYRRSSSSSGFGSGGSIGGGSFGSGGGIGGGGGFGSGGGF